MLYGIHKTKILTSTFRTILSVQAISVNECHRRTIDRENKRKQSVWKRKRESMEREKNIYRTQQNKREKMGEKYSNQPR